MNIVTRFDISQKKFHWYWLPLIYKHQDCEFYITAARGFIYPKDLKNLKVNQTKHRKGHATLDCPMNLVPTYRAMEQLNKKNSDWYGTHEDLGEKFYEIK